MRMPQLETRLAQGGRMTRAAAVPLGSGPYAGQAVCLLCPVRLQPTPTGDLADGVRAHYKTVHPERTLR